MQRRAAQGGSTIAQQFVKLALRGPGRAHGLPEGARGGAGVPPHAQVVEGEDPHRVPELDLLRQRRLRHRVGRADLLRRAARRLRRRQPALRERAHARRSRRSSPASCPRRACTTRSRTRRPRRSAATSCSCGCSSRAISRARSTTAALDEALPGQDRHPPAVRALGQPARRVLRRAGSASRSPTTTAPGSAFEGGLRIRTTLDVKLQTAAEQAVQRVAQHARRPAGLARRDRQRHAARSARWSAATTSRRARSTSRRRASASPARRSSRSSSRPRSSAGSRPDRCGRRKKLIVTVPGTQRQGEVRRQQLRGLLPRVREPADGDDLLGQLRLRRRSAWRRACGASRARPRSSASARPVSSNPAMHARRPEGRRHRAGHGPRVREPRGPAACASAARSGTREGRARRDQAGSRMRDDKDDVLDDEQAGPHARPARRRRRRRRRRSCSR